MIAIKPARRRSNVVADSAPAADRRWLLAAVKPGSPEHPTPHHLQVASRTGWAGSLTKCHSTKRQDDCGRKRLTSLTSQAW
ncbi:hypothetical protein EHS86_19070 [Erwinia amylovora]|nr:hypothetical protein EHS86_19070 [Erwinia amylovora]